MSTSRPTDQHAHADLLSPGELHADCEAATRNLRLERVVRAATRPAPSIHFDDFPREIPKRDITVSDAAARLASALHLHLN